MKGPLNGHTGEAARWVIGLVLVGLTTYFTSDRQMSDRVTLIDTREQARFDENQRAFARIESALARQERDLRRVIQDWSPRRVTP